MKNQLHNHYNIKNPVCKESGKKKLLAMQGILRTEKNCIKSLQLIAGGDIRRIKSWLSLTKRVAF